jgi:hypothetical protein
VAINDPWVIERQREEYLLDLLTLRYGAEAGTPYLDEYLRGRTPSGVQAQPQYFADGDFLVVYFSDARCHAKRSNDSLTVYYSDETGQITGCKIAGAKDLVIGANAPKPPPPKRTCSMWLRCLRALQRKRPSEPPPPSKRWP